MVVKCPVGICPTIAYASVQYTFTSVTFYKVPEQRSHVYLVTLYVDKHKFFLASLLEGEGARPRPFFSDVKQFITFRLMKHLYRDRRLYIDNRMMDHFP